MSVPILATKLYIPPPGPRIVPRQRLVDRLNEGLARGRRITLISASAGHEGIMVNEKISIGRVRCGVARPDITSL